MLYFITEGNNVRIKDGDNDFRVLHNTSNCINWTVYDSKIDLSIDEVTFDQVNPMHIYFDGVAASTSEGVVNSLKGMFSNLGSKAKVYRALLTQTGTDAPVATVLENTLGDIVWSRQNTGAYTGLLEGVFSIKTSVLSGTVNIDGNDSGAGFINIWRIDADTISIESLNNSLERADGKLFYTTIEILVYP